METTVKQRLENFIEFKNLKKARFESLCGLSNGYVANIKKGIGYEILERILRTFPELNRDWLLYGEGTMLKPSTTTNSGDITITGNNNSHIGHGNNYAGTASTPAIISSTISNCVEVECPSCGTVIEVASDVILPAIPQKITRMPNVDLEQFMANHPQEMEEIDLRYIWGKGVFVVEVDTRVMEPEYRQGTRLVLRKLPGLAYARPDGSAYVIDTMLPHTLFRYFSKERDGSYKLSASRESGRDPLWLQESDIQHIYDIVGYFKVGR